MKPRHYVTAGLVILFVATVYIANWLVNKYGVIRIWPFNLSAPCAVYIVGVAFLLRDSIQRLSAQWIALAAIAAGTVLSVLVNPQLALASGAAFAASEVIGWGLFLMLGGNRRGPLGLGIAVVLASLAAAALDSYIFLTLAPAFIPGVNNVHAFFEGQFVGKISVLVLAIPFVFMARKTYPTPEPVGA